MPDVDAFDFLRRPYTAATPRPAFAAALRQRLQEELTMTMTQDDDTTAGVDHGALRLVHVRVGDADRAILFFSGLFGWVSERYDGDGHVSHYTTNTAVTVRLLDDPSSSDVRPNYAVRDVAAAIRAVEEAGGTITSSGVEADGGGWAYAEDRAGLPLLLFRPGNHHAHSDEPVRGDVGLVFLIERATDAAAFYGPVLEWDVVAGHPGSTYYDTVDRVGVWDRNAALDVDQPAALGLFVEVEALRAVTDRIVELGGDVDELPSATTMGPYFAVQCRDDQGTAFGLISLRLD